MKKLIFFFAATILSLTSCSKDDDNENDDSNGGGTKLPKSVITTTEPGGSISSTDYTYDGTKISTASTSNTNKAVYSYNSENILSRIEYKTNDVTTSYTDFTFENGDIKSETTYSINTDKVVTKTSSTAYTYDAASKTQTVIVTDYPGGTPKVSNTTTVNTYDDNNLVKTVVTTIYDDKNDIVTTTEYTYDSKTNYFINVTGYPATIVKGKNNQKTVTTKVIEREDNVPGTPRTTQETYDYTYDGSFPTNIKNYAGGTLTNTIKVFYN